DHDSLWPADEWDAFGASLPLVELYAGAAGMAWALHVLEPFAEPAVDPAAVARRALELFREDPGFPPDAKLPEQARASPPCGETGMLLAAFCTHPAGELAGDLLPRVRANLGNPADELMWGVPGTLLAARVLATATGDERWRRAVRESEEALRAERGEDGFWQQDLHGRTDRILGPVHGLVGNVLALGEPGHA